MTPRGSGQPGAQTSSSNCSPGEGDPGLDQEKARGLALLLGSESSAGQTGLPPASRVCRNRLSHGQDRGHSAME